MALPDALWAVSPEALPVLHGLWLAELRGASAEPGFSPPAIAGAALASVSEAAYSLRKGVAVIRVRGALGRETVNASWSGRRLVTGYDDIRSAVESAASDPAAKAILLALDSPGGSVSGCKELADSLAIMALRKPCAAYADGLCASAAFWLASATGRIFAPATAQVGSIGVVFVHTDLSRLNEKIGVAYSTITGGEWKAVGHENAPLAPEHRAYLQQRVGALHTLFRADVARHMGLDVASASTWGDGQIFLANEAQSLGLVSATVAGLDEAIHILSEETHMDKTTLAASHPELLAQLEAEAKEAALKELTAAAPFPAPETVAKQAVSDTLALVSGVLGAEAAARVETLIAAGVTPTQLAALAPLMGGAGQPDAPVHPASQVAASATARAAMLAAVEKATPAPLPGQFAVTQGATSTTDALQAAIERMASMGV